nr:histidine phosphatase family protein [Pseudomonas protegens]
MPIDNARVNTVQATRLTLICHARTAAQKLARFPRDEPLELDWQAQALSRAGDFKRSIRVLCGPELRTRQSAQLFSAEHEVQDALRDCDFGAWQGLRIDELQEREPEALQAWLRDPQLAPPGGESLAQLCQRVAQWLEVMAQRPGHWLAVTHPFVIRAVLVQVLQAPLASFNQIDIEPLSRLDLSHAGRWRLRLPGPPTPSR